MRGLLNPNVKNAPCKAHKRSIHMTRDFSVNVTLPKDQAISIKGITVNEKTEYEFLSPVYDILTIPQTVPSGLKVHGSQTASLSLASFFLVVIPATGDFIWVPTQYCKKTGFKAIDLGDR